MKSKHLSKLPGFVGGDKTQNDGPNPAKGNGDETKRRPLNMAIFDMYLKFYSLVN